MQIFPWHAPTPFEPGSRWSRALFGLVVLAALIVPASVFAQEGEEPQGEAPPEEAQEEPRQEPPEDAGPSAEVRAMLQEGINLRAQGRDAEALERFEEAYGIERSPLALAQIALAEQALGRWISAYNHLTEALSFSDDSWIADHRDLLSDASAAIRSHLGRLALDGGVAGATVRINGELRGTLPLVEPLWVVAGRATVVIEAEGYHPFERTVEIVGRGESRESVQLVELTEEELSSGDDTWIPGWAIAGGGVAVVIVGVALGGLALIDRGLLLETCLGNGMGFDCPGTATARRDAITLNAAVADGFVFTGAAIVATGVLLALFLEEGGDGEGEQDEGESPEAASARLSGGCTTQGCALGLEGRF